MARPAILGVPWDASSSFLRGPSEAPPLIRAALASPAGNPWSERLVVSIGPDALDDAGDLALPDDAALARRIIEDATRALARDGRPFVALGGDHSITYPILRGLGQPDRALTILHIDAHADLYDVFEGDRYSHACPFARIMEERLASRLVQVGIRTMNGHQAEQAARFGVEQIHMRDWARGGRPEPIRGPVYLSIDLDSLDPAFAPGVSHREPGGLSVRELLSLLDIIEAGGGGLVGADVVEFNPRQDASGVTAVVAAKLVKEIAALWMPRGVPPSSVSGSGPAAPV